MANIQERVNSKGETVYRVQVRLKGAPAETATFSRRTDAKNWATQTEADIRAGRHVKNREAKRRTVKEMIEQYEKKVLPTKGAWSLKAQGFQLAWWKKKLGAYKLADVTPAMIAQARDELAATPTKRKDTTRSNASVVRYMAVLSHCFTVAMKEWGWIENGRSVDSHKPLQLSPRPSV